MAIFNSFTWNPQHPFFFRENFASVPWCFSKKGKKNGAFSKTKRDEITPVTKVNIYMGMGQN